MKKIISLFAIIGFTLSLSAQSTGSMPEYRRSSLYSILIQHPEKEFYKELAEVFDSIPIPDKFDDHNLSVRILNYSKITAKTTDNQTVELFSNDVDTTQFVSCSTTALKKAETVSNVTNWLYANGVARRMVAKWFDRDRKNGAFDMDLIANRGLYDASAIDVAMARESVRGRSLLSDAGEELIGNTFIVVNDITYVNKEENAQKAKGILNIISTAASYAGLGDVGDVISATATVGALVADNIAGFTVRITTHLFRLNWDDEVANRFYQEYYFDKQSLEKKRKADFEKDLDLFTLTYIGSTEAKSAKTTMRGVHRPEDMIRKVCTRAIDNNIVTLQRTYDVFKVKMPLVSVEPLQAPIGVKEGISERSRFEVLERIEDENGRSSYRRVGVIQPIAGKIWDNSFMATEEEFKNANLSATEFKKVSGGPFFPGMLIREMKF